MGYVSDMRKLIGHRPLMIVGAAVIVEDGEGRILLQRRTDNHCWGYPGGCTEPDEVLEDAARRELFEETGLTAGPLTPIGAFSGPALHYVYPNGDEASVVEHLFLCREWSGTLKQQEEEVEDLRFFAVDEIPENLSPPNRPCLEAYLEKRKDGSL